jgi:transposase
MCADVALAGAAVVRWLLHLIVVGTAAHRWVLRPRAYRARCALDRMVLESTGALGRPLLQAARAFGVNANCVPPQRVRKFAEAIGVHAKTDKIDARVIAHFAATATFREPVALSPAERQLHRPVVLPQQGMLPA